jgi:hypothetical protein
MNRNVMVGLVALFVIGVGAILLLNSNLFNKAPVEAEKNEMSGSPQSDESKKAVDLETTMEMKELLYQYSGELTDVTNAEDVRGINTGGNASGVAKSNWDGSQYLLFATFENLPEPTADDFYEGWIVREEPFAFISTGKVEVVDGVYTNSYRSDQDLTEYNVYVLTLEPNDDDPAPADHIVDGTMVE